MLELEDPSTVVSKNTGRRERFKELLARGERETISLFAGGRSISSPTIEAKVVRFGALYIKGARVTARRKKIKFLE